jgi:hypothetical protein
MQSTMLSTIVADVIDFPAMVQTEYDVFHRSRSPEIAIEGILLLEREE